MKMSRAAYARLFGPTTGDRVRLGDTSLLAEIEQDLLSHGDELSTGAGKTMRDGELRGVQLSSSGLIQRFDE